MIFESSLGNKKYKVKVDQKGEKFSVRIDDGIIVWVDMANEDGVYSLLVNHKSYEIDMAPKGNSYPILINGRYYVLEVISEQEKFRRVIQEVDLGTRKNLVAAMPGKIVKILVSPGAVVKRGEGILIMEAMKMENELKAPAAGRVKTIQVKEGENVDTGEILIIFE